MNKIFVRSLWQVYREQRLLLLLLGVMVFVLGAASCSMYRFTSENVITSLFATPALFLLLSFSMTIVNEKEQRTYDQLRLSACPPVPWLLGRIVWAVAGTLLLWGLLVAMFQLFVLDDMSILSSVGRLQVVLTLATWLEAAAFAILASTYGKTVVRTIVLAAILLAISNGVTYVLSTFTYYHSLAYWASGVDAEGFADLEKYQLDKMMGAQWYLLRFVVSLAVFGWGCMLVARALSTSNSYSEVRRRTGWVPTWRFGLQRVDASRYILSLLWQEYRLKGFFLLSFIVGFAACQFVLFNLGDRDNSPNRVFVYSVLMFAGSALFGLAIPRAENEGDSAPFWEQVGISARRVVTYRWLLFLSGWFLFVLAWFAFLTINGAAEDFVTYARASTNLRSYEPVSFQFDSHYPRLVLVMAGGFTLALSSVASLVLIHPIAAWCMLPMTTAVGFSFASWWTRERGVSVDLLSAVGGGLLLFAVVIYWVPKLIRSHVSLSQRWLCASTAAAIVIGLAGSNFWAWLHEVPRQVVESNFVRADWSDQRVTYLSSAAASLKPSEREGTLLLGTLLDEIARRDLKAKERQNKNASPLPLAYLDDNSFAFDLPFEEDWLKRFVGQLSDYEFPEGKSPVGSKGLTLVSRDRYTFEQLGADKGLDSSSFRADPDLIGLLVRKAIEQAGAEGLMGTDEEHAQTLIALIDFSTFFDSTAYHRSGELRVHAYELLYRFASEPDREVTEIERLLAALKTRELTKEQSIDRLRSYFDAETFLDRDSYEDGRDPFNVFPLNVVDKRIHDRRVAEMALSKKVATRVATEWIESYYDGDAYRWSLDYHYGSNGPSMKDVSQLYPEVTWSSYSPGRDSSVINFLIRELNWLLMQRAQIVRMGSLLYYRKLGEWPLGQKQLLDEGILDTLVNDPYATKGMTIAIVTPPKFDQSTTPVIWTTGRNLSEQSGVATPFDRLALNRYPPNSDDERVRSQSYSSTRFWGRFEQAFGQGVYWRLDRDGTNANVQLSR